MDIIRQNMKTFLVAAIAVIVLVGGIYFLRSSDDFSVTGFAVRGEGQGSILTGNVVLDTDSDVGREQIIEEQSQIFSGGSSGRVKVSITVVDNKTEE